MELSDSSDDIVFLDEYSTKLQSDARGSGSTRLTAHTPKPTCATEAEPDWVRDHTPQKRTDVDRKEAILAALDDDEDDDSIIDLVTQERPSEQPLPKQAEERSKGGTEEPQRPPAAKKARLPTKPKSKLPLIVAPKLDDSLVLLQSVDGEMDLSGDVGAVGRVKMQQGELFLDIKGVVYRTIVNPCNSLCVVSVGEEEARVTAILDDAVVLASERNLFASDEVLVHGELGEEGGAGAFYSQSDDAGRESEGNKANSGKKKKNAGAGGKQKAKANSKRKALQESERGRISKSRRPK